jgi:hypothetical protein
MTSVDVGAPSSTPVTTVVVPTAVTVAAPSVTVDPSTTVDVPTTVSDTRTADTTAGVTNTATNSLTGGTTTSTLTGPTTTLGSASAQAGPLSYNGGATNVNVTLSTGNFGGLGITLGACGTRCLHTRTRIHSGVARRTRRRMDRASLRACQDARQGQARA